MEKQMDKQIQDKLRNKRKIEKDEESVKPRIINDEMIRSYIKDYNKDNRIFDKNDMHLWELEHLSLSYKSKCLCN